MSHEAEYRALVAVVIDCLLAVARHVDRIAKTQEDIAMDTKKLLAEVAREKTDSASMRALVDANQKALQSISSQNSLMAGQIADLQAKLDAALAAGGADQTAQIAALKQQITDLQLANDQAQQDIDSAVADLSADSDAAEKALAANVSPTTGVGAAGQAPADPSANAGASAASSSSSSSSTASDGGGVQKPDPLPGTGQPTSSTSNSAPSSAPISGDGQSSAASSSQSGQADPAADLSGEAPKSGA